MDFRRRLSQKKRYNLRIGREQRIISFNLNKIILIWSLDWSWTSLKSVLFTLCFTTLYPPWFFPKNHKSSFVDWTFVRSIIASPLTLIDSNSIKLSERQEEEIKRKNARRSPLSSVHSNSAHPKFRFIICIPTTWKSISISFWLRTMQHEKLNSRSSVGANLERWLSLPDNYIRSVSGSQQRRLCDYVYVKHMVNENFNFLWIKFEMTKNRQQNSLTEEKLVCKMYNFSI